jgi:tetratricopeptide (TPR) repeat protein
MKVGAARSTKADTHNEAVPTRFLVRAALVAICLVGATVSVVIYVSEVRLTDGLVASRHSRECPAKLAELQASDTSLNPSLLRDFTLASCLYQAGRGAAADRTFARAIARDPRFANAWYALALYEVGRGRRPAAIAAYTRARALDPNLPPHPAILAR